jgi:alkanesulfonate monooxygenase SsuD/methylene tetrahydromethanopterin reductase-like flavin-dependent oxidoreductase (luciferase family)
VILPNHSSLVIAEQFGTLSALHGDRIDLGLGRAPGTDQLTSSVLRRGAGADSVDDFPNQVVELLAWFGTIPPLESGIGSRVVAVPGLGFAFAHHFAGGPNTIRAFDLYRSSFTPSVILREPHAMVSVSALVADDRADAERLALPNALTFVRMRQGARPARIPSLAEAQGYPWSSAELEWVAERNSHQAVGDLAHVSQRIAELVNVTGADEVILAPQGPDLETKLRTLRDLSS